MEDLKDIYVTYKYIGNDERVTKRESYLFIQGKLERARDIEDIIWDVRTKIVEEYNIEPNDIDPYKDILITYIKEF